MDFATIPEDVVTKSAKRQAENPPERGWGGRGEMFFVFFKWFSGIFLVFFLFLFVFLVVFSRVSSGFLGIFVGFFFFFWGGVINMF